MYVICQHHADKCHLSGFSLTTDLVDFICRSIYFFRSSVVFKGFFGVFRENLARFA